MNVGSLILVNFSHSRPHRCRDVTSPSSNRDDALTNLNGEHLASGMWYVAGAATSMTLDGDGEARL